MTPNWKEFIEQVRHEWMEIRKRSPQGLLSCHYPDNFPLQVAVELIHKQGVELARLHMEVEMLRDVVMEL